MAFNIHMILLKLSFRADKLDDSMVLTITIRYVPREYYLAMTAARLRPLPRSMLRYISLAFRRLWLQPSSSYVSPETAVLYADRNGSNIRSARTHPRSPIQTG